MGEEKVRGADGRYIKGTGLAHGHAPHGKSSKTYSVWSAMKDRCSNPNNPAFHNYGGRGIRVCERWLSFANFLEDMGEKPEGFSIDRKNNDGDYEPGNCRWATKQEQVNNMRVNRFITHRGFTLTLSQWCRTLGLPLSRVEARLRRGWEFAEAVKDAPVACPFNDYIKEGA